LSGDIKTLTVKRDAAGRLWLFFSVVGQVPEPIEVTTCRVAGFAFGLKTFLTDHTRRVYSAGRHHFHALNCLRVLQSRKDKKPHPQAGGGQTGQEGSSDWSLGTHHQCLFPLRA
jgi:putative transposase